MPSRSSWQKRVDLRPLVLGWLLEGPCHGYALVRRLVPFEAGPAGLNEGRIYRVLGDLEREGLVRSRVERTRGGPDRKVLRLTRAGRAATLAWLHEEKGVEASGKYEFFLRDPFLVRYLFAHRLGPVGVRDLLRRHVRETEARIGEFTRLGRGPVAFPDVPGRIEILGLGLRFLVAKLRWLRGCLERAETVGPGVGARRRRGVGK